MLYSIYNMVLNRFSFAFLARNRYVLWSTSLQRKIVCIRSLADASFRMFGCFTEDSVFQLLSLRMSRGILLFLVSALPST